MSQKQLGVRAGVDEFSASPRMNQYERGRHIPNPAVLERLAAALKVPVGFFCTRDDLLADLLLEVARLSITAKRRLLKATPYQLSTPAMVSTQAGGRVSSGVAGATPGREMSADWAFSRRRDRQDLGRLPD
jgi:transcriptional regulator with XRE-family HTH domain